MGDAPVHSAPCPSRRPGEVGPRWSRTRSPPREAQSSPAPVALPSAKQEKAIALDGRRGEEEGKQARSHPFPPLTSSSDFPFLGGSLLNSSESPRTKFRCRSKAMNLPARANRASQYSSTPSAVSLIPGLPAHNLPAINQGDPHPCENRGTEYGIMSLPPKQKRKAVLFAHGS